MTVQPEIVRQTGGARLARIAFVYVAGAFALCVIIQIFLAGLAVFVSPLNWVRHISFVHLFEFLPLLMLVLSFVGRLPKALRWQSVGLFVGIFLQYFTANIGGKLPWVAALHPVVAMVIFWMAITLARNAWDIVFRSQKNV